jgi:two-component system cell cycle response regulator DivK
VLRKLRASPHLAGAKIVAVTAGVTQMDVARAEAAEFDGFIGKPLDFDRFPEQIRRILAGERVWMPV